MEAFYQNVGHSFSFWGGWNSRIWPGRGGFGYRRSKLWGPRHGHRKRYWDPPEAAGSDVSLNTDICTMAEAVALA